MHRVNWDDLRFVLAVADHGSVSAAVRVLNVNHATVLRRIALFEERHGSPVFDKNSRGYSLLADREQVIAAARDVESAIFAVGRMIEGTQAPLHGVVRVTSTDTFCQAILPPLIAGFRESAGSLQIELLCSNRHLDLAKLDADITVRPAAVLPDELVGDVVGRLNFAVYAAPDAPDLWLGLSGALARSRPAIWQAEAVSPDKIASSGDSFLTLLEMAACGMGKAILPCLIGDADGRLVRVETNMPKLGVDVWVASHADLADVPRIHAVRSYLVEHLSKQAQLLSGQQ